MRTVRASPVPTHFPHCAGLSIEGLPNRDGPLFCTRPSTVHSTDPYCARPTSLPKCHNGVAPSLVTHDGQHFDVCYSRGKSGSPSAENKAVTQQEKDIQQKSRECGIVEKADIQSVENNKLEIDLHKYGQLTFDKMPSPSMGPAARSSLLTGGNNTLRGFPWWHFPIESGKRVMAAEFKARNLQVADGGLHEKMMSHACNPSTLGGQAGWTALTSQSAKHHPKGDSVPFTPHQEPPSRGAGKKAAPAERVALATCGAPPLGMSWSVGSQNLS
ncbi:hypothetical protein AAY473_027326, partial [Plecturocebus cupreus]